MPQEGSRSLGFPLEPWGTRHSPYTRVAKQIKYGPRAIPGIYTTIQGDPESNENNRENQSQENERNRIPVTRFEPKNLGCE